MGLGRLGLTLPSKDGMSEGSIVSINKLACMHYEYLGKGKP
jgi:hypothetical protein